MRSDNESLLNKAEPLQQDITARQEAPKLPSLVYFVKASCSCDRRVPVNDEHYPPYPFLYQVASHCASATSLYLDLWKRKSLEHDLHIKFNRVAETFCMSRTKFHNLLMNLSREGVVEFVRETDAFRIKIVAWMHLYDECENLNMLR